MLKIIEEKDHYTKSHCCRVGKYSTTLAKHSNSTIKDYTYLRYAAELHDIGKCMIPDEILKKPGKFTPDEMEIMKKHSIYTGKMLKEKFKLCDFTCQIAESHHERYDGTGYPKGLKGNEIPVESRIIAICDTFDAITTDRPYQKARTAEEAIEEMDKHSHQYDPELYILFKQLVKQKIIIPDLSA